MIAGKPQVEEDLDCFIESETMSTTTESSFDNQGGRNRNKTQVEKKMKKLRSIKLSRISSTRKGRSTSSQFRTKLSGYAASSEQSTPIEMSDASPNHINGTNLENFQVLPTTESEFELVRSVTRKSSMKFRRPQMKKKSSRRDVNSQDMNKEHLQSSSCYSRSSFDNSDQDKNISANEIQQSAYPANKSSRVVRTSTLGPMKILTKMASLRSKRTKKCSEIPSIPDSNVERDTCSSTLKSSKIRDHLEMKPGRNKSDGTAALNVCRYSYCSLHGHRHGDKPPPLKRFVSTRRRAVKSQKSMKPDPKSSGKPKHSGNGKKGVQSEKRVLNGDIGVADQQTTFDIREVPFVPGTEGSDFVDLAESVPGESSYPSHEERQSPETFQVFKDIGVDCSGIGGQQKATCDTSIKTKETERIKNGDRKSIQALDHLKGGDVSSKDFGDPTKFDNLSCDASVPLAEESHTYIDEDLASSSNLEEYEGHSGDSVKTLETVSTGDICKVPNSFFSSAPVTGGMEKPTSAIEDKKEGSDLQPADPMAASTSTDVASKKEMEQKNFTFWKLIYQKMATGLDVEPETQTPLDGMNSEEQAEDLVNAHENNDSCQENSREGEDHEGSNPELEFSQSDAIKLVQQAFDKMLSEIPDNSSDDQSIVSEKTSDHESLLKKDEGKEVSISTSSNSIENSMLQDREKMNLQTDKELMPEEVKAAQKEGKRSDTQMPSSWSSLKKIIILRRFVKSLEKVRNLKPKTICYLPPAKDQEAENIQLRPQTEKRKKNAEEWMLDLALRQVISTLAPSQKTKVAMLIQAFETVIPAENGDDMRSNVAASSPTTVQAYNEFLVDNGDNTENQIGSEISPGKLLCKAGSKMSGTDMKKEDMGVVDDNNGNEVSVVDHSISELEEPRLADKSLIDEDAIRTSHDKNFPVNEDVIQPISKEETSVHSSEVCNAGSEIGIKKLDLASNDSSNSPDQQPDIPECPAEVGEGAQPKYKFLRTSLEQSESNFVPDISMLERQKYTRLWYLIYKHMVSHSAKENGSQPLADEEVQSSDASQCPMENNADCQASFSAGHSNEIIKLVEEAIDEIPLPEVQDDTSENQSVFGDVIPDQELLEKKHGQEEEKIISISTDSAKENSEEAKTIRAELCSTMDSKEKIPSFENADAKMEAKERTKGNKSKKRVQRNWSNLKKLVLLRRFVKALEKVKEFNPRGPRFLPVDPAPESEKVLLRQQNMGDKKSAEEWMLDYALQQVVAKLTPERKRRVGLLVEAFETVIPTIS